MGVDSGRRARRPDSYHHGNLRRALLDAAMELVAERGVDGFTLREVSRRAGVSHAAPYHHFEDKASLVSTLAVESLEMLRDSQVSTASGAPGTALDRVRALGFDYLRFALDNPERFKLMFRPELRGAGEGTAVDAAGLESYAPLVEAIAEAQETGEARGGDTGLVALAAWSSVHGLASIIVDGPMQHEIRTAADAEPIARGVLEAVVEGLRAR